MHNQNQTSPEKDSNLMQAVQLFEQDWMETYPDELMLAGKVTYSKRHTKRIQRMLQHHDDFVYRMTCTPRRQIAAAILAILLGCNTVMMSSVEVRAEVFAFFTTKYETFTEVFFPNTGAPLELLEQYEPSYIPEGYVVNDILESTTHRLVIYTNQDDEMMYFTQSILDESMLQLDTEGSEVEDVAILEYEGLLVYNKNIYSLSWSNQEYQFTIIGDNKSEIIAMAGSLKNI